MIDWKPIIDEAERLAHELRQSNVDLNDAKKAGDYFVSHDYDENQMQQYLEILAKDPPKRSKLTSQHYRGLRAVWNAWHARTTLREKNKARAWFWGIRLAQSSARGQ